MKKNLVMFELIRLWIIIIIFILTYNGNEKVVHLEF